ncbi:type I polyketide synthase [Mycobacterium sp. E2733]|uniref:type I polyketide synthase n=1 Tax=Mycobacterium sp. E2733 TaxID=1834138 RepID=UPI0007FF9510|nr:type I polyketide synthase [Mycobacterium sp. E2733]OBH88808.1 polyketide synthase [Mycobacterium sp. E2733]
MDSLPANAIAVVGMAGRFPGANSVSEFWDSLRRGEESIVTLSEDQLSAAGVDDKTLANPSYIRRASLVDGIDEFDADFFGFPPQAARIMDPQHRLFLQCCWHALEDSGCDPARYDGSIGVFATSGASMYMLHNLLSNHDPNEIIGEGPTFDLVNMSLWNDKDYLATRVSHQFNLRGPSVTVQTACSSSLVAIHLACQSLLSGESDMVLAGGVSLRIPHHVGYWHQPGSMVSPVGHCRPFDVRADGTVFGSGVATVALKPLQAAVADGDRIHAVIRGSAINNDGSMKMTYAAPSPAAQADVIAEAHAVADIDASTISYVETHGTGTPLGDPIEIEGLRKAFGVSEATRPGPCVLGAVKSNIGHLGEAAGVVGLVKTILCLKNRAIPGTLHYTSPNPELHLENGPFVVQNEYSPWEWDGVRRAGISSFGVGGTNAHLVLEEAPQDPAPETHGGPQVLCLSARTSEALDDFRSALAAEFSRPDALDMSDAAFTLAGRRTEEIRMAAVVQDQQDAARVLQGSEHNNIFIGESVENTGSDSDRVVFLFPGQGAQHPGMARGLYEAEPVFTEHFDECAEGFRRELGIDLRTEIFSAAGRELERTDVAQPALFTVEYALGKLIESYGVRAAAFAGHSIGEYAAATLANVFDLSTAIKVVSVRARLMHESAPGAMVAVAMSPEAVAEHLTPGVDLAVVNDPANCVLAGSQENIRKLLTRLQQQGTLVRRVRTSHAFHSSLMDPVVPEFAEFLSQVELKEPQTPLLSNVTGSWVTAEQATDPAMWARQIRATVRFSDELELILADPRRVLIEVGPGGTLTGSAIRHPNWSDGHRTVRLMRHQVQTQSDRDTFLLGLGQLWAAGIEVDWSRFSTDRPRLLSLPGYPFARRRHWVDPNKSTSWAAAPAATNGADSPNGDADNTSADTSTQSEIEATLQRIWTQCLGINSIGLTDNFFEVGGDSIMAIGVAMSATNQGLELRPQDLYENQSISMLAADLAARYAAGGLASMPSGDDVNPPVPPSMVDRLEHGLREAGRGRVPLILRLGSDVGVDDVRSVLTAVTNHHDALRLTIVERAGSWEQHICPPAESIDLTQRSLPAGMASGSQQERDAVSTMITEEARGRDASTQAFSATYIVDSSGEPCYLGISVLEMIADGLSREILLSDIFTAFAQRLAGEDIVLPPTTATWREWSQRCATLVTHPAVLESRDYWLENSTKSSLQLTDQHIAEPPEVDDLAKLSSALTDEQTSEVDHARHRFQFTVEEVVLGALARTIAQALGEGVITVNLSGDGRSVLKPDVDPRRAVGGFATIYPMPLTCLSRESAGATEVLADMRDILNAVPHHGIGHGLLRYLYAPTARLLGAIPPPDVFVSYEGVIPDLPPGEGPVEFIDDFAMPVRDKVSGLGRAIELRVYRWGDALHADWWYDTRRIQRSQVETLAEHFPAALTELVQEAMASARADGQADGFSEEVALVDLSAE